jgi:hypothetical protein
MPHYIAKPLMSGALLIALSTSTLAYDDVFIFTEIDKSSQVYSRLVETQQILKNENTKSALTGTLTASSKRSDDLSKRLNVSPEFLQFLAGTQFSPDLMKSGSSDGKMKFFAAIDVGDVERKGVFNQSINAANSIGNIPSNTVFSSAKQGWFSTDYPEINSNLRCDWSVNLRIKTLLDEQAALKLEAELEANHRNNLDGVDIRQGQQNVVAEDEPQDDVILDDESADGLHKTIRLAGIPCLVTYYCDDVDWPCSVEKLNEIVARVRLVNGGE